MFTNRHSMFGYLSVILVVFAIAISASCKLAEAAPKPSMVISLDADTGLPQTVVGVPAAGAPKIPISGKPETPPKGQIKHIRPALIITYVQNPNCITFVIAGTSYTYCF